MAPGKRVGNLTGMFSRYPVLVDHLGDLKVGRNDLNFSSTDLSACADDRSNQRPNGR